ncbi:hypothetical protein EB1_32310 [Empedobacter brevis NBRC 14943 = ATCC 43319]|uniref:Uncharacterized protein n=1 Tax=Empedobacter brevis NBRC 14943 = ATCC 43319 TaxID=1218108 RepID=A0A511NMJ7_9FLAO|nr:hypothetical protein EB1_32310 [Empedobacter brevis NBRC 14943 = ATCC 43319]
MRIVSSKNRCFIGLSTNKITPHKMINRNANFLFKYKFFFLYREEIINKHAVVTIKFFDDSRIKKINSKITIQ